jgi:hypothetical protein
MKSIDYGTQISMSRKGGDQKLDLEHLNSRSRLQPGWLDRSPWDRSKLKPNMGLRTGAGVAAQESIAASGKIAGPRAAFGSPARPSGGAKRYGAGPPGAKHCDRQSCKIKPGEC